MDWPFSAHSARQPITLRAFPQSCLSGRPHQSSGYSVLMWREEGYLVKGKGVRFQFFESKGFHVSTREETTHHTA